MAGLTAAAKYLTAASELTNLLKHMKPAKRKKIISTVSDLIDAVIATGVEVNELKKALK